eukprot:3634379-Prymnesium_polylepis.1
MARADPAPAGVGLPVGRASCVSGCATDGVATVGWGLAHALHMHGGATSRLGVRVCVSFGPTSDPSATHRRPPGA